MTRRRILVVDDEPAMLRALQRMLAQIHQVECCSDPIAAMDRADVLKPVLVILDIYMPNMNGFELLARLRDSDPQLLAIFITGALDLDEAEMATVHHSRVLFKPFDRSALLGLIDECMKGKPSH